MKLCKLRGLPIGGGEEDGGESSIYYMILLQLYIILYSNPHWLGVIKLSHHTQSLAVFTIIDVIGILLTSKMEETKIICLTIVYCLW